MTRIGIKAFSLALGIGLLAYLAYGVLKMMGVV
jgi:hypothetical protein